MFTGGVIMWLLCEVLSDPLARLFAGYDAGLMEMMRHGLRLFSISYILAGVNFFCSSLFTSLNNGLLSAIISFSRSLIFECGFVLLLPIFWGLDGIWLSMPFTEAVTIVMSAAFVFANRKKYGYI